MFLMIGLMMVYVFNDFMIFFMIIFCFSRHEKSLKKKKKH